MNTDAEKILFAFVVFSESVRKNFFLYENFSTNQISRKNRTQFFDNFVIGIERWVNSDAEKILLTFLVFSKSVRKNFCLNKNFSTNQNSRRNQIELLDYFLIGIGRWVNSDAENIVLTFVVFCKSGRKFFFIKIFQQIRFREKIELNFSIILSLESRDESTVMLKKFHWPLLYSPNRWEKIFVWIKFFQPIRIREEIKLNY